MAAVCTINVAVTEALLRAQSTFIRRGNRDSRVWALASLLPPTSVFVAGDPNTLRVSTHRHANSDNLIEHQGGSYSSIVTIGGHAGVNRVDEEALWLTTTSAPPVGPSEHLTLRFQELLCLAVSERCWGANVFGVGQTSNTSRYSRIRPAVVRGRRLLFVEGPVLPEL